MRKTFILFATLFYSFTSNAQIDHWESVIVQGDEWAYTVPTSQPDPEWITIDYDDSGWSVGNSGFGYGDEDDNTMLANGTAAVYIRKSFNIVDLSAIEDCILHLDYDDGFVAYLNGQEIARGLVSGTPPDFDQFADNLHEASLYQGLTPQEIDIDKSLLAEGENILAIEVHNESETSSDLSAIPVLSVGINNTSSNYQATPSWFQPPLNFTESTLPIVVVDTDNQEIVDDPKIGATLQVISNGEGEVNHLTDASQYEGFCGIELRGESSLNFDKKSYAVEMWDEEGEDMDTTFLNFPAEEDFILYGPYADKSLINNRLAMKLANDMGHYASRTKFVELVINGEYLGIYVLMEKIKRDDNRVDINKLKDDEISGDDLTGGYIFRIDKGDDDGWSSNYNAYHGDHKVFFQYYEPEEDDIQPEQKNYIEQYVDDFEEAVTSDTRFNHKGKHYTEYIDLRSFIDNFIINELSKNVDGYRLSSYFYKDKDSKDRKIKCGYWDFNLSFGNADYCGTDDTSGWIYYQCDGNSPFWWHNMLQDTLFTNALHCRWEELRNTTLSDESIDQFINDFTDEIAGGPVERNYEKWQVLGIYLWPNPPFYEQPTTYEGIITNLKGWLADRLTWMDANMPGESKNCEIYEDFDTIEQPEEVTLGTASAASRFRIYPNPAENELHIEAQHLIEEVLITNLSGQTIASYKPNAIAFRLNLEPYSTGLFLITVKTKTDLYRLKIQVVR